MRWTSIPAALRLLLTLACGLLLVPTRGQAQTVPANQGLVADSTELRVLREFYQATGGAQWTNRTGWPQTAAAWDTATVAGAASWQGLWVDKHDVWGLNLPGNHLAGQLPASLGALTQLNNLSVPGNQLSGSLPASLANLTRLNNCALENNQLSGELTGLFNQLHNLQNLNLTHNQFTGPIPGTLGSLARLYVFNAGYNQFSGPLPAALGNCQTLWGISLDHNQLSGPVPGRWGRMGGLRQLFLGYNQLSGPLPDSLANLTYLDYFDAEYNQFSGSVPTSFARFNRPLRINLTHNQLSGSLPPNLKAAFLLLGWNHLSGEVPAGYATTTIVQLGLDNNDITRLPHFLQPLGYPNLQLFLTGNYLEFDSYEPNQAQCGQGQFWDYGQRTRPGDTTQAVAGQPATLNGTIGGAHNHYQWQRLVGGQWVNLPGDTLALRTRPQVQPADAGAYRTAVTNGCVVGITLTSPVRVLDVVPYQALTRNLPDDDNQGTELVTPVPAADATGPRVGDVNFVRSWVPRVALTEAAHVTRAAVDSVARSTQYLDGLGRPVQTVQHQASPAKLDVVQLHAYDGLGREPRQYLPYPAAATDTASTQGYHYRALTDQQAFYRRTTPLGGGPGPLSPTDPTQGVVRTGVAYSETLFEASPLGRVRAQAAPGETWRLSGGHIIEHDERPNTAQDSVPRFQPGYDQLSRDPGYQGFYAPGELWGTVVADAHGPNEVGAHGYTTIEWKDKLGQVVCRQVESGRTGSLSQGLHSRWLRTVYAFDDFGRLRYVVQPEGVKALFAALAQANGTGSAPGLQLWLKLDESTGTQAADASGQGRAGTLSGGGSWQPTGGHDGGAALALVAGQSLHVPLSWTPNAFTVSFWLKSTRLFDYGQGTGAGWGSFQFYSTSTGAIYVGTDVATRYYGSPGAVQLNQWQHFVFTRDAYGQGTLYQNGQVLARRGGVSPSQTWTDFQLGVTGDAWYDEVRVYDRALTDDQVRGVYRQTPNLALAVQPFLFTYRYDGRGRQIAKQVPGQAGETTAVYDQLDRPILSQDAAQRLRREWNWTKYDALGRVVLTGLVSRTDTVGAVTLQAWAAADTAASQQYEQRTSDIGNYPQGFTTANAFPRLGQQGFSAGQVLSATSYDDYDFNNDGQPDVAYNPAHDGQFASGAAPVADVLRTTGLVTRTSTRVLGETGDATHAAWLVTTTFYDERARPVQVQSTNARNGQDLVTTQLDFAGQVRQSVTTHQGPLNTSLLVKEQMTYDHAGRLLTTSQQLPGESQATRLVKHTYNSLGQLRVDSLGTGRLTQSVDYAYNTRGWLTSLNDPYQPNPSDLFSLSLHYERGFTRGYEQYNGNLTGQTWRGRDGMQRAYGYVYDPLNRLLQGDFVARPGQPGPTPSLAAFWNQELDHYRLAFVSYDDNGNILTLRRQGLLQAATHVRAKQYGLVDNLRYAYEGNRLQTVTDQVSGNRLATPASYHGAPTSLAGDFQQASNPQPGAAYQYDAAGNLTADNNKNITGIAYNHLNLPRQIHFGQVGDSLAFRYTAAGQKVAKLVYQTGKPVQRTDYVGPFQYEGDSLRFFPHAAGRVLRFVSYDAAGQAHVSYQREFTIKDHLGNLRLAYRAGERRTFLATLEQDNNTRKRETQQFDSLSVSPPVAQATPLAHSGNYAARLNAGGNAPQPLGPLTQLAVQKGDTVLVTAYGLYPQPVQHSFWFSLGSWLAGLVSPAQAPAGGTDGRTRRDLPLLQVGVAAGLTNLPQLSGGVPQGYLRLLVFNRDSALVDQKLQHLTQAALNNNEQLSLQVVVPQDGYVSAYVGNGSDVDVFFDDVQVEHRPGVQVQEVQYDPAGLELAGLAPASPGIKGLNNYRFNGKELQSDLGLAWNHQDWRFFDPQLLRWHSVDPELENGQESWTPYSFGYDNAVRFADANGRAPDDGGGPGRIYQRGPNAAEKTSAFLHSFAGRTLLSPLAPALYDAANTVYSYGTGFFDHSKAHTFEGYGLTQKEYQMAAVSTLLIVGSEGMGAAVRGTAAEVRGAVAEAKAVRPPCGCFTAGTAISLRQGRKPIEQIQVGDSVWAYNERTHQVALRPVTQLLRFERDTVYALHTAAGEVIRTTSDHPFYVRGQWVRVKRLRVGDSLVSQSGQRHMLRRIEVKSEHVRVYNFTVDELHNYFVGTSAILVHNSGGPCGGKPDGFTKPTSADDIKYANRLTAKRAPVAGAPYETRTRYHDNGDIRQVTTYDKYGDRHMQYDLKDSQGRTPHQHKFEYNQSSKRPGGTRPSAHGEIK